MPSTGYPNIAVERQVLQDLLAQERPMNPPQDEDDYFNLEGKLCSVCDHKAYGVWSWAPGHHDGYRCACCMRATWEETMKNLEASLRRLPDDCVTEVK